MRNNMGSVPDAAEMCEMTTKINRHDGVEFCTFKKPTLTAFAVFGFAVDPPPVEEEDVTDLDGSGAAACCCTALAGRFSLAFSSADIVESRDEA